MTSIKLTVTGAEVWASVNGILTSGMVGIPVTIEYDASWDGLRKNLVCRCSPWNSDRGDYRTILNVGEAATVAHEVMQHGKFLYLGVEGYSSDGKLVMPTRWAECGEIHRGANSGADISADPTLPVWEQLQTAIEEIKENPLTEEQLAEIQAGVQSAVEAAKSAEANAEAALEEVLLAHADTELLEYRARDAAARSETAADKAEKAAARAEAAASDNPVHETVTLRTENAADGENGVILTPEGTEHAPALVLYGLAGDEAVRIGNVAEAVDELDVPNLGQVRAMLNGQGSGQNAAGLTAEQINALDGILRVVAYNSGADYAGAYAAFCRAFGLTAPDGGDDSGGGSGGEDSGGNDDNVSNEVKWTDGVAYTYEAVEDEYVDTNGAFTAYKGWNRTPYLYCKGAAVIRAVVNAPTSMLGQNNTYNAFYDEGKNFVGGFSYAGIDGNTAGSHKDIEVPANAAYFVASHKAGVIGVDNVATDALGFVPYREVPV